MIEDITRYFLNDEILSKRLKTARHNIRLHTSIIHSRDIVNDVLKQSTSSEMRRENLRDIVIANFKRTQESARVLEELFKLDLSAILTQDSAINSNTFKSLRYELYDIEQALLAKWAECGFEEE